MKKLLVATLVLSLLGCDESTQTNNATAASDQGAPSSDSGDNATSGGGTDTSSDTDFGASTDTSDDQSSDDSADSSDDSGSDDGANSNDDSDADDSANSNDDSGSGDSANSNDDSDADGNTDSSGETENTDVSALWGECTSTANLGSPLRRLDRDHRILVDYADGGIGNINNENFGESDAQVITVLSDGCASDSTFLSPDYFHAYIAPDEKGLYLWLAPDSGAAMVEVKKAEGMGRLYTGAFTHVIQSSSGINKPVFFALSNDTWRISISPLDADNPVQLSEVRTAPAEDDISSLRKARFSGQPGFAAMSGDPRAAVTAEIANSFAIYHSSVEGWQPTTSCGTTRWIDATWETSTATVSNNSTWINWNYATNESINAAIRASLNPSAGGFGWLCEMPDDTAIEQDWMAKAQAALDGNDEGPELFTAYDY